MRAKIGLFLLVGTASHEMLAHNVVNSVAKVERFAKKQGRPFIAKVYRPSLRQLHHGGRRTGKVELWLSYEEWLASRP